MATKCPNCQSADTQASLADLNDCVSCGATFNSKGDIVGGGPDADTRAAILARLEPKEPSIVGNLADLQRLGAENAPKEGEPAFTMPPGTEVGKDGDPKFSPEPNEGAKPETEAKAKASAQAGTKK